MEPKLNLALVIVRSKLKVVSAFIMFQIFAIMLINTALRIGSIMAYLMHDYAQ